MIKKRTQMHSADYKQTFFFSPYRENSVLSKLRSNSFWPFCPPSPRAGVDPSHLKERLPFTFVHYINQINFKLLVWAKAPLSQTPKNSFKRWPSPRNDLVVSNKLFQGPFIPLLWILFGQTGYPIKFFTYK